jgi:DNA repair exonuclease SbcCD ATPase subunit
MASLNAIISQLNSNNFETINKRANVLAEKNSITSQLQNHLTCPKCQEALMYTGKILHPVNKEMLTSQLNALNLTETSLNTQITFNNDSVAKHNIDIEAVKKPINAYQTNCNVLAKMETPEKLQAKIADINTRNQQLLKDAEAVNTSTKQTLDEHNKELAIAQARLAALPPSTINVHDLKTSLESKQFKVKDCDKEIGRLQQLIAQVNQVKAEIDEIQKVVGDKKQEAEIYSFWESGFREIKIKIIEEFLPALEDRVNDYLEALKVNMRVDFDTKRAKASAAKKDLEAGMGYKEEFNITVLKSETVSPFNMLSQGERGRVATCAGMALRELTRENGSNIFDFLLIDEIADALDKTGLQELIKLMDEIHGQKLVISHSDSLKELFDQAILVEITDGISGITNQAF